MGRKAEKPKLTIYLSRNEVTGQVINAWLKDFDPDANEGLGFVEWTDDREEARVFDGVEDVHAYWSQQSTALPLRPDGKPNRPLTAFTIEVRPVEKHSGKPWGARKGSGRLKGGSGA
jgi:hypothetical protein